MTFFDTADGDGVSDVTPIGVPHSASKRKRRERERERKKEN